MLSSPPGAIVALLLFTADIAAAVAWQRVLALWQQACQALTAGGRRKDDAGATVAVAAA